MTTTPIAQEIDENFPAFAIVARNGYDKSKNPEHAVFVPLSKGEVLKLRPGRCLDVLCFDGSIRTVRITGAVRTWKRSPDRVEVPAKYGWKDSMLFSYNPATGQTECDRAVLVARCSRYFKLSDLKPGHDVRYQPPIGETSQGPTDRPRA